MNDTCISTEEYNRLREIDRKHKKMCELGYILINGIDIPEFKYKAIEKEFWSLLDISI